MWKITSIIPIIACFIVIALDRELHRWKQISVYLLTVAFAVVLLSCVVNANPIYRHSKETGHPIISWIALGMTGNGECYQGMQFVQALNEMDDKTEKVEYSKWYISEHLGEAFSTNHIVGKIQCNFATGTMNCSEFLWIESDGTLLWELMACCGKHYWKTSQFCFIYIISVYTVILIGRIVCLVKIVRGRGIPTIKLIADISLFGIIVFLMLWEAKGRQMYNQFPMIIIDTFISIEIIVSSICCDFLKRRKNEERP